MAKLTDKLIRDYSAQGEAIIISDSRHPNFAVRIWPSGKAVFIYRYRTRGRQRLFTIGPSTAFTISAAREEAKKLAGMVARGDDPQAEKEAIKAIPLFRELAKDYLATAQKKSIADDKSKLKRVLIPKLGKQPVDTITASQIRRILKKLTDKGLAPATVNRYRSLLSVLFNRAIEPGWIAQNPITHIKPLQENNKRDRWLSDEELDRLFLALDKEPKNAANAIRMLLATGARRNNVLSMKWTDVNRFQKMWAIPETKNGKSLRIPLNETALGILNHQGHKRQLCNPYVFPGKLKDQPLKTVQQAWNRAVNRAGLKNIRLHDLRHTFASRLVIAGVDLYAVSKLLGHHSVSMTERYAHLNDQRLQDASSAAIVDLDEIRKVKMTRA